MKKREELYHMTKKEMARLKVAERLLEKTMKVEEAARILNISTRQVIRIKKRVKKIGPEAVIHGNRKRKPKNATEDKVLKVNQNSRAGGHENSRPQDKKIIPYHPLCP